MEKWFEEKGNFSDVVISSRVRLARNLREYPFSTRMSAEGAASLVNEVMGQLSGLTDSDGVFYFCNLSKLSKAERIAMMERHVLSPQIVNKKQETGLIVSKNESLSIMVNEEDHLRIQGMAGGMHIEKAFQLANEIDDIASSKMEFAFDEKYGYLTTCPTNVGTGLRASYMVFLPALSAAGKLKLLSEELNKYGITLRGMYGEGSEGTVNIYQISNQKTLGNKEQEIIDNLNNIVLQVIRQERKRREYVLMNNYDIIEDQIYRSYGVLKYARQINTKDAMTLLSQIKFGFDTGILKSQNKEDNIFRLMMEIQPYNLLQREGKMLGNIQRDKIRAEYIRTMLPIL
ncbi:protein arginine kinase [Velocimicrobium porci]|uniref:Protein arginine kinase n=1 Tax=Velocimicrobium porci TaxID=2606634 RepID=A0A6L5XW41_9FIRM|nr:protein arginine kinase [Velocimicrobium porci]MSS62568.1 protein arginine kinase [Velocimicrobium porci]